MTPTTAIALFILVAGLGLLVEGIFICVEDYKRYKLLSRCYRKLDK